MVKKLVTSMLLYGASVFPFNGIYEGSGKSPEKIIEISQLSLEEKVEYLFNKKSIEQSSDEIITPRYKLKSGRCSKYALLSAKKLFGKEYQWEDAWNLRYSNKVVHEFDDRDSMKDLVIEGKLVPGMIVGIFRPNSIHNGRRDKEGNERKYTHVALYIGINDDGELEFVNQLGRRIERITEEDFNSRRFIVKEIIAPKEKDNL